MPRILHISCDFGDQFNPAKTAAVSNLVAATSQLQHTVFSLNRSSNPARRRDLRVDGQVYSIRYFGLPAGVGLRFSLERAASRLSRTVAGAALDVDVVHCHKLTFEGPIGRRVAADLGCPFVCTVRGDTDLKVLAFKPGYRNWYRSVLQASSAVFFVAPWTQRKLNALWPDNMPARQALLPNIVELPDAGRDCVPDHERIVSVMHFRELRRKNLRKLLEAVDLCWQRGQPVYLDIIGGGDTRHVRQVEALVSNRRHPEAVRLLGHFSRDEIANKLPEYAALVLPSRRETFGMVYLEALLSGIPFLHSRETGLDGYFDGAEVSVAVDPGSADEIAAGIRYLLDNGDRFRANVAALRRNGGLAQFDRDHIVRTYTDTITDVLEKG